MKNTLSIIGDQSDYIYKELKLANLDEAFFCYAHKNKLSQKQISQQVVSRLAVSSKIQARKYLYELLLTQAAVTVSEVNEPWESMLRFAKDWNRYSKFNEDELAMKKWIKESRVYHSSYRFELSKLGWLLAALLSYLEMTYSEMKRQESPNHYFLKILLKLYFLRQGFVNPHYEHKFYLYGDYVFSDVVASNNQNRFEVGEVGGVQLWKVMGLVLRKEIQNVYVMPHWTTIKQHPFKKMNRVFTLHQLTRKEPI